MKNILLFPAGSEISIEVLRSLKTEKDMKIFGASSVDDAGRLLFDNYIDNVPFIDDKNFINKIKNIVDNHHIDIIYPCVDAAIPILKKFESYLNCIVISPNFKTAEICLSKRKTYQTLVNHIKVPKEYNINNIPEYPVFLKPEIGSSSKFTYLVNNKEELDVFIKRVPNPMILEYLPNNEFTVDCFSNYRNELLFVGPRIREKIVNGISVKTSNIEDYQITQIAEKINKVLNMDGAWFFQLKQNKNNEYTLLEVACRFGGSSSIQRYRGLNFSLMSLYNSLKKDVSILINEYNVDFYRTFNVKTKININYDYVYLDFDDTVIVQNKVNVEVIKFMYHMCNVGKKIILITKHKDNIYDTLETFKIPKELFYEIIHIDNCDNKHNYIKYKNSIFIDDSFNERKDIKNYVKIPVFSLDTIDCLC